MVKFGGDSNGGDRESKWKAIMRRTKELKDRVWGDSGGLPDREEDG